MSTVYIFFSNLVDEKITRKGQVQRKKFSFCCFALKKFGFYFKQKLNKFIIKN